MNKLKTYLITIGLFALVYFLQVNFFTWFNIAGVMPNLFVVFVMFLGLYAGKKLGMIVGVILGIILDMLIGKTIGFSSIFFGIAGLLGEYFDKNFSKNSRIMIILMSIGCTVLYEVGMYVVNIIRFNADIELIDFLIKLLIENCFNVLIIIIIYPLMKKLGYYIESIYKEKQILTRYF